MDTSPEQATWPVFSSQDAFSLLNDDSRKSLAEWLNDGVAHLAGRVYQDAALWKALRPRLQAARVFVPDYEAYLERFIADHPDAFPAVHHAAHADTPMPAAASTVLEATRVADAQERDVDWLWYPYIPLGAITMLDGDPGVGKSLLTCALSAAVSNGHALPAQDGKPPGGQGVPGTVLMFATEDSLEHTIKPRLVRLGADTTRIIVVKGIKDKEGTIPFTFEVLQLLKAALEEHKPRLVIFDPIQAYMGSKVDIHRANETRPILARLASLAAEYACAILCVRHQAKASQGTKASHRGLGSIDFTGAARSVIMVDDVPGHAGMVFLMHSKCNLAAMGVTLLYDKSQGFAWAGATRLKAEDIAGTGRGPDPYAKLTAALWLEKQLANGTRNSQEIEELLESEDIAIKTYKRARGMLGVVASKEMNGWILSLPPLSLETRPTSPSKPTWDTRTTWPPSYNTTTYIDSSQGGQSGLVDLVDQEGQVVPPRARDTLQNTECQYHNDSLENNIPGYASRKGSSSHGDAPRTNGMPRCVHCGAQEASSVGGMVLCVTCNHPFYRKG